MKAVLPELVLVRVTPRASANAVQVKDGFVHVRVTATPTDGAANAAVVALLAKAIGVGKSNVEIVAGTHSRTKKLAIKGMTPAQVIERLSGP